MKKKTLPVLIMGSSGDASDIRYGCGYVALDPTVFLVTRSKNYLVAPLLELGRAKKSTHNTIVVTPQELSIPLSKRREIGEWAYGLLKKLKIRHVAVPPSFPAGILQNLQKKMRVTVLHEAVFPERAIKSSKEVAQIREVQRAAVAAMKTAVRIISLSSIHTKGHLVFQGKPLTSERVRLAIEIVLLEHGCFARDTIVAGGSQGADPHDRGSGVLRAGEPIVLDIFPQHKVHGYWGDITRTVVRGPAHSTRKRMYRAVKLAQEMALAMIRPGVPVRKIHEEIQRIFEKMGFETSVKNGVARGFFHGTGHGVGLDIHEAPSISLNEARLAAGQVVTVEPGLYYPEWGGVRIEDTVVVTKRGWRYLATCGKQFSV